MMLDVNGNDNSPEWGWCTTQGCSEEAFPIWKSGDYPDDPDLLLCPKHLGLLISKLEFHSTLMSRYLEALGAAYHALMSYAHGNTAPALAAEVAEKVLATIEKVRQE